ncbi:MAG TPA: anaerobic sulfatase-maturation protein [Candidatus Hydrogenedentes bacterium]|nr:anaerobic sulfatase-maturation protein [Candidatus Hydrogenedentota bacterium]
MVPQTTSSIPAFHVMVKPAGPACNLQCKYCFYLEKEKLFPDHPKPVMPDHVLESFIRQHIESQDVPEIHFAWQGGEPTLLGVEFFRKVAAFQKQYANGKTIQNAFQTNGTLLNDEWCAFFKENNFLIGLSLDGPDEFHDRFRCDKGGHPTFSRVMRGMDFLNKHEADFNILTCVQRHNSEHPLEVYRFLRDVGSGFIQFIPIVERAALEPGEHGLTLVTPDILEAQVTPWSVRPLAYGKFLSAIFDEWVRRDVGSTFVQIFDICLEGWVGMNPSLCFFSETCGTAMALEHNGNLYSCDHFVYPSHYLGNILEQPLPEMVNSPFQRQFGRQKRDALPTCCKNCDCLFICHGECPKHRFLASPDGEPGLAYLCEGYQHFFRHIDPYMHFMANELRAQRPPANVMRWIQAMDLRAAGKTSPGPNDPCSCGSGKKFKKCCGVKHPPA